MPLTVTVGLIVLVVIALVGVAGYLIDSAEEKVEQHSTVEHDTRPHSRT